jgi:HD-GYP domain-containing protein (c-di-GMP phosphodiesterase class II)
MYDYQDSLAALNKDMPLADKLNYCLGVLRERFSFIHRISISLYDPKTDVLKTYIECGGGGSALEHYEAALADVPSLRRILELGVPRVVNDLQVFDSGNGEHTRRIAASGFRSSYTMPMYLDGVFFGFVFFNSRESDPFRPGVLHYLDLFGHLIALVVINDLAAIRTLTAAVKTIRDIAQHRDLETGAHLDRMSHYARLIAHALADKYGFDDEYIERVFLFSPLHDIGKIGVPDRILLKPARLSEEEYMVMQTHARKGREIIDTMLRDFGLESLGHVDVLRNITEFHHEAVNGSGYPNGLAGDDIPIEARIIAVADVFDALTSARPYKEAWDIEKAFGAMRQLAGKKLDPDCVEALIDNEARVRDIHGRFAEDPYG